MNEAMHSCIRSTPRETICLENQFRPNHRGTFASMVQALIAITRDGNLLRSTILHYSRKSRIEISNVENRLFRTLVDRNFPSIALAAKTKRCHASETEKPQTIIHKKDTTRSRDRSRSIIKKTTDF